MNTAKNILAATDFSELGRGAVDHALELAQILDAKLNVVSVLWTAGSAVPPAHNRELHELREQMSELEAKLKPSGRLAQAVIEVGDPASTILRVATRLGADMIVMGTNNRQGFSRLVVSSTAEHVLRDAHIPVLVLKKAALRAHAAASEPGAR